MLLAAENQLRLDANWVDYLLVAIYFGFVLGIGLLARRSISTSIDFFLSGRSLPAWVTGLAFISANLGAVEIMGMSANGAQFGIPTVHYFWVGAVPAMLFLGVVMMPFYYGSKVRSVPEFMRKRFGPGAHLVNAISFAVAQLLIAGINLFLLAKIVNILLGWNLYVSLVVAALIVLSYILLGGLSAAIYNEVLQFFVIVAALAAADTRRPEQGGRLQRPQGQDHRCGRRSGAALVMARHQPDRHREPRHVGDRDRARSRLRAVLRLLDDQLRRGPACDGIELDLGRAALADHRLLPEDVRAVHRDLPRHDRRGRHLRGGRGEVVG